MPSIGEYTLAHGPLGTTDGTNNDCEKCLMYDTISRSYPVCRASELRYLKNRTYYDICSNGHPKGVFHIVHKLTGEPIR